MKRRNRIELLKAKIAFAMLFIAGAAADSGIVFLVIALFTIIWLNVCIKRLESRGVFAEWAEK